MFLLVILFLYQASSYKHLSILLKSTKLYGIPAYIPRTVQNHTKLYVIPVYIPRTVQNHTKLLEYDDWDSGEITWRDIINSTSNKTK